jgi:hypothetical protein
MYLNTGKKNRPDPTPQEIKERCAQLQSTWDEHERQKRSGCLVRPVEFPEVKVVVEPYDYSRA